VAHDPVKTPSSSRSRAYVVGVIALLVASVATAFAVLDPTPPRSVVISTGPPGSTYHTLAERYRERLAEDGVELILRGSAGAADNLLRLNDPDSGVDIGFVSMGLATLEDSPGLRSLGAMFYEPVWVFYTGSALEEVPPVELRGQRLSVGVPGGLAYVVSLRMLELLEVSRSENELLELEPAEAVERLRNGGVDIAFFAAPAGTPVIEELLASEWVKLAHFPQADAYIARYPALTRLTVPAGVGSLALRLPPADADILAFTGSVMVRRSLHPAIQSLLLEAANEIHGAPDMFHAMGPFPRPETLRVPLSDSADQFYRSGRPFLQRYLPFWMAVLVMQLVAIVIPLIAVVYPFLRVLPSAIGWAMRRRITRLYGELRLIELAAAATDDSEARARLSDQLESLERKVGRLRLPESFAPLVYTLRLHIDVVRSRYLVSRATPAAP
jgi:TRAP-type uncharacterized transport system substrate-binding protein